MPFVLDNAVVTGWYLESQATRYTDSIAERLRHDKAVVPALWTLEFSNVLRTACVRGAMTFPAAQVVVEQIGGLPIEVDRKQVAASELLGLAMRFGLSSYDAAYLELALRLALPVATGDARLRDAALASGVGVVAAEP